MVSAGFARAERIAPDIQFEEFRDWSGGLRNDVDSHLIGKGYSDYMINCDIEEDGGVVVRSGYQLLGSTPTLTSGKLIFIFNKPDNTQEFIVSDSSLVLTTADFVTYRVVKTGLNPSYNLTAKQIRNEVWFTNGNDSPFTYNGTTVVVLNGTTHGGSATPVAPKGKYIEYDQDRVWLCATPDDQSICYYSAVSDTGTVPSIIAPTYFLAWPAINALSIGRGDGTVITFVKSFKGRPRVGKERSIYSIFGNSQGTYVPVKTRAQTGIISSDPVELDNLLYGQGPDGFYAFDGENVQRLTDHIPDDVEQIRNDVTRTVSDTWETKEDFEASGLAKFHGTTVTADGLLTISTYTFELSTPSAFATVSSTDYIRITTGTQQAVAAIYATTRTVPNGFEGVPNVFYYFNRRGNFSSGGGGGLMYGQNVASTASIKNTRTGREVVLPCGDPGVSPVDYNDDLFDIIECSTRIAVIPGFSNLKVDTGCVINQVDIQNSRIQVTISALGSDIGIPGNFIDIMFPTKTFNSGMIMISASTGQYTSEITTVSTISGWGAFDSIYNQNGGSVQFYIKTATSVVNIATKTWTPITPGSVLASSTTENYFQWASTISSVRDQVYALGDPTNIDNVSVSHTEGQGANTRSFAISWDAQLWIGVSTESTGNWPVIYKKSHSTNKNPLAWMRMQNINIRSIAKSLTTLYGGGSTSGSFYRLDFGEDDNGVPIHPIYETPEMTSAGDFVDKTLLELVLDTEADQGNTLRVGISKDGGDFSYQNVSLNGSGRLRKNVYNVDKYGRSFKFRFEQTGLGAGFKINRFGYWYRPIKLQ